MVVEADAFGFVAATFFAGGGVTLVVKVEATFLAGTAFEGAGRAFLGSAVGVGGVTVAIGMCSPFRFGLGG